MDQQISTFENIVLRNQREKMLTAGFSLSFYRSLLPERQSHGHGASSSSIRAPTSERLRENRREQTCLLSSATKVE